jgi:hypothetical protein
MWETTYHRLQVSDLHYLQLPDLFQFLAIIPEFSRPLNAGGFSLYKLTFCNNNLLSTKEASVEKTTAEKLGAIEKFVREICWMPPSPTPVLGHNFMYAYIPHKGCIHCFLMHTKEDRTPRLTAVLRENGVDPKVFVEKIRNEGVTNIKFEDGQIKVPRGSETILYFNEPVWHRVLSFPVLMRVLTSICI